MNILFYLVPKNDVVYVKEEYTLRQALAKMEYHRFTAVPMVNAEGQYVGTLTEGDILWELHHRNLGSFRQFEEVPLKEVKRDRYNDPVNVNCEIEDLILKSRNQNFVPVVDDNGVFIGIVTRKCILEYCCKLLEDQKLLKLP